MDYIIHVSKDGPGKLVYVLVKYIGILNILGGGGGGGAHYFGGEASPSNPANNVHVHLCI